MTESEIRKAIDTCRKGANVKLEFERPAHLRAKYRGMPMFKRTLMTIRVGVDHDTRIEVQAARENGDAPAENAGLSGCEWLVEGLLLRAIKTGEIQLRVEPSINANEKPKSVYFVREAGIETPVNKEEYRDILLGSEFAVNKRSGCFNLGIKGILSLHNTVAAVDEDETEAEAEAAN